MRVCIAALLLALAGSAFAHDHERPELNDWFMSLHSRGKQPCCDGSDATSLEDPDWENNSGHYRVRIGSEWVTVPDDAIIDSPNKDGRAMVWPYYINGELRGIRCFLPGSMT